MTAKAHQLPAALGRFQLGPSIGQGGMGEVYRALDTQSGEDVAIKVVVTPKHANSSALRSEIEALRAIRHPGVVRILEEGLSGGVLWYAMDLLEGRTLAELHRAAWQRSASGVRPAPTAPADAPKREEKSYPTLPSESTPERELPRVAAAGRLTQMLQIFHSLCEPLGYMHSRGLIHKDLKPSNIFIKKSGQPVLLDFGLATLATAGSGREALGRTAVAFGTVGYASPEQIRRELVDARADLYSLGCLLYESLTGAPPFEGESDGEILDRHLEEPPMAPSALVAGIPPELDRLVLALLEKSRVRRVGHANEVASRLEAILGSLGHDIPRGARAPAYLYRPQLVGREALLTKMVEAADAAQNRRGGMCLVQGESGIGKTFLVTEFVRRVHLKNQRVITGECQPGGMGAPSILRTGGTLAAFKHFLQVVADQCRAMPLEAAHKLLGQEASALSPYDPVFAHMARELGRRDLTLLPSKASRERVFRALETLLTNFCDLSPTTLVIDDLQWADDLSLAFLERIRERLSDQRVFIVATCRAEEMPESVRALSQSRGVERLALDRLDEGDVERIVSEMLAMASPPPDLVAYVARQSEGNPFFVGEYLRMLHAEGLLVHKEGRWRVESSGSSNYDALPLPSSLEQLVLHRLSRLSESTLGVVQAAAVLGRMFTLDAVASVSGLSAGETETLLNAAMHGQVLDTASERRFRFVHDKLREFAYTDTPQDRRRELHMRAARYLEARHEGASTDLEVVTSLLQHLRFAHRDDKLLDFLGVAGELALAQSAHEEAVAFLREAIVLEERQSRPGRTFRLARWERQIGEALQGLGDLVESMNHLERAATHLGRPLFVDTLELAPRLGYQVLVQTVHRIVPRRILELYVRDDPELLESARIHDLLLQVCLHQGDLVRGVLACLNTLNLTEVTRDSPARAVAYANGQLIAGLLPWRGLTESYSRHAKATLQRSGDALAASYHHMTEGAYRSGRAEWQRARNELERALKLAQEINFNRRVGDVTTLLGTLAYLTGEFDEARAHASRLLYEYGAPDAQVAVRGRLGRAQVAAARNRFDEALGELENVVGALQVVGIPDRIWAHGLSALVYARLGRLKEAEAAAAEALYQQQKSPPSAHHAVTGYVAAAGGLLLLWEAEKKRAGARAPTTRERRQACQRAVRAVAACARVYVMAKPSLQLVSGHFQRLLDRPTRARDHWQKGLASATKLRMPYEQAQLHLALGSLTECISERERQASSDRARRLFDSLGCAQH